MHLLMACHNIVFYKLLEDLVSGIGLKFNTSPVLVASNTRDFEFSDQFSRDEAFNIISLALMQDSLTPVDENSSKIFYYIDVEGSIWLSKVLFNLEYFDDNLIKMIF